MSGEYKHPVRNGEAEDLSEYVGKDFSGTFYLGALFSGEPWTPFCWNGDM